MDTLHTPAWHAGYFAAYRAEEGHMPAPPPDLTRLDLMDWLDGREVALEQIEADRWATAEWYDQKRAQYERATWEAYMAQTGGRD